jgi:glycogen operon protein
VTCHDGFTLNDLLSYRGKHNEANGEGNRDGADEHFSRNWGVEGPTESLSVLRRRERAKRNFLATLAFSQGVPMISHGDEVGRTQRGNNNPWCQDNEVSWVDWELDEPRRGLLSFMRQVFGIRRLNPVLRRRSFFRGRPVSRGGLKDVAWIRPDGAEMTQADWGDPKNQVLGMLIPGQASDEVDERGRGVAGETLLLLLNAGARSRYFRLPILQGPGLWRGLVNTARPGAGVVEGDGVNLVARSLILLSYGKPR